MKYRKICLFLVGLLFVNCSSSPQKSDPINDTFQEKQDQVKRLIVEIFETAKAKDMGKLDAFHLNSTKFTKFDDGDIPGVQDYAIAKRTEEELFMMVSDFNYELQDFKVDVFDDMAIAAFILDYSVILDETTIDASSRSTLVFVLNEGNWLIAHEHFSPYISSTD